MCTKSKNNQDTEFNELLNFISNSKNNILLIEPNMHYHSECLLSYINYFLILGYNLDLIISEYNYNLNPFCRFNVNAKGINIFNYKYYSSISKIVETEYILKYDKIMFATTVSENGDVLAHKVKEPNKLILMLHSISSVKNLLGSSYPYNIFLLSYFPNNKFKFIIPHYFGDIKVTTKNTNIIKFITIGRIDNNVKDYDLLINTVRRLISTGYRNFKVTCIGWFGAIELEDDVKPFIDLKGKLDYESMFIELENSDFYLSLLNPYNKIHLLYSYDLCTGSNQLVLGFKKPFIINEKYAKAYGYDKNSAIIYNNNDLFSGILNALNMKEDKYNKLQQNISKLGENLHKESLINIQNVLNNNTITYSFNNSIDTKEISVIVQGAICEYTNTCLNSIRKYLPGAEIILSTWEGSNIEGLDYDIIILNEDPGTILCDFEYNLYNNTNRQLLSTQNALNKSNRKYTLKFRTDNILYSNSFLIYFNKYTNTNNEYKIFKNKVITTSTYSKEYSDITKLDTPFHISDFFLFGLTEDIKDYFFNTKLLEDHEASNYKVKYFYKTPNPTLTYRYSPEQYMCFSWVKRHFKDIEFDDWSDWNMHNINISNNIIYSNFIILDPDQISFYNPKHSYSFNNINSIYGLIRFDEFNKRYNVGIQNMDNEFSHLINNIIKYIRDIESQNNSIIYNICNFRSIIENTNRKNIFSIIGDFIFSINYYEDKKIFKVLGIKITLKSKAKQSKAKQSKAKQSNNMSR